MMNSFVSIVSVVLYIFSIFFCADSPIVSQIGVLNIFSLLHVPLYGFLTFLLLRAFGWDRKIETGSGRQERFQCNGVLVPRSGEWKWLNPFVTED